MYGRSSNGPGVYATSSVGNGIEGYETASGSGYYGQSDNYAGVRGMGEVNGVIGIGNPTKGGDYSSGVVGVAYGNESTHAGYPNAAIVAISASGPTPGNADIFDGYSLGAHYCRIDADGNLTCSGSIQGGQSFTRQRTETGRHVLTYAAQSATATIEDVGTARMSDGVANVRIDPAFVSVMDHKWYYVFLTPLGDTRGLYVSAKTASGFQVRETEHGRSNLEFDYRIVAHPLGIRSDRLPLVPPARRFTPPVPAGLH